jgi:DNA polymerase-3 subunit gamma/tau
MTVLYRKYRPRTFSEVAGQEHVKAALANEAASGNVAHSYLFSGPRGVGKTSIARIFAKAINCLARAKDGDPCGTCGSCREIAEGRALDVIEIDAASHTGVDNVREQVIEHARFAPSSLAHKVFIIDEVHMLSTSAFNDRTAQIAGHGRLALPALRFPEDRPQGAGRAPGPPRQRGRLQRR